ncbi:MAG: phosphotransferase, partial [Candidatus Margulisbacteria bacterium]|nr:phosphotransferase [Candidatus Margulisiibacteriota bacterium]
EEYCLKFYLLFDKVCRLFQNFKEVRALTLPLCYYYGMEALSVWQKLNHDTILQAVEAVLKKPLSNLLLPRNSYINRVYELEGFDTRERLIVKFYRPQRWTKEMILEEHGFLNELAAKDLPVIPPININGATLFFCLPPPNSQSQLPTSLAPIPFSLFPKKGGRALDEFDKDSLLHGDCHKGNLIHRPGEGIYLVDFDDLCFGPPVQDVWLLLPEKPEKCENELSWFLKGYELFMPFERKSLELVPLLRGMRIIHFAAWLAIQIQEADFPTHFPEAGTTRYWNELIKELQEIAFQIN